jgi:hypothetical protein
MKNILLSILICFSAFSIFAQDENVIYSFKTKNNKVVELIFNESDSVFIYRFLSKGKIELEIRDDLTDTDTIFTVKGYSRGGGVENAAMDYNDIYFSNNGYDYDIYYVWGVNEEDPNAENNGIFGIKVLKEGIEIADIKGSKIITGSIIGYSFYDILPESKEN